MSWEKKKIIECCSKVGSGATPKGGATVYVETGTSLIRSQNVYNLSFDYDGLAHINNGAADKLKGVTVEENDILLNITGDSVARTCMVPKDVLPARVNQHVAIVRTKKDVMDSRFLNYYLVSPYMQAYMLNLAVGKGASRNAMTKGMIENFEVPCPDLSIQKRIADILSAYDDLIEVNRKQIKLLEEAAERLYQEWFIDLRFPGHETANFNADGLPQGWRIGTVSSIIDLLNGFAFKSSTFEEEGKYHIVTIKNVQDGYFEQKTVSHIDSIPDRMPAHCKLNTGDILLSLTGNVGRICLVIGDNYLLNQRVAKLKSDYPTFAYCLFKSYDMFVTVNNLANGAAQQNVSPIRIGELKITIPEDKVLKAFEEIAGCYFREIQTLYSKISQAVDARDMLLPRLMNGEIKL